MHGPVLPGAVFMSDPWTQEGHCGEPRKWKEPSYAHHSGPQLSGALLHFQASLKKTKKH